MPGRVPRWGAESLPKNSTSRKENRHPFSSPTSVQNPCRRWPVNRSCPGPGNSLYDDRFHGVPPTGQSLIPLFSLCFLAVSPMQSRRSILKRCGIFVVAMACLPWLSARDSQATVPRGPLLERRLLTGLRVKRASDRQFISRVVMLVGQGILPVRLVDSTFFWARARAARHRTLSNNPMVYFRPALIARARALRISI